MGLANPTAREGAMETAIVVWLVLGFVFGGMTLALALGYLSTEKARAGKPAPHPCRRAGSHSELLREKR
jgi:hypothetical protein